MDDPDGSGGVIDDIADASAAGDLEFPLLQFLAIVAMSREIAAQAMLALMIRPRAWISAQRLETPACVAQGVTAQFLPSLDRVASTEPDIPLAVRRRDRDPVTTLRTHAETPTGPKSPLVASRAWA